ncbi:MAG: hypothetical protein P8J87_12885, partial [Verrucomicrobiales bacterium]|nr:hypothetical protein [Verrucomicrobiales bacterium]
VEIEIENPKAVLDYRKAYGFGSVQIGASLLTRIQIENTGTGPYRGVLTAAPPWQVLLEDGVLEIPEGEARELKVKYTPTEAIDSRLELQLGNAADGAMIVFTGEGAAPFIGGPSQLTLSYDPDHGDRRGNISLRNTLGHAQTVSVVTVGNLKVAGDQVTLPPQGKADVQLTLAGKTAYKGEVKIRSFTGYEQVIGVEAQTMPARLSIVGEAATEGVSIERVLMGESGFSEFGVQNVGGGEGTVIVEATTPFFVKDSDRSFSFVPAEQRSITVGIKSEVSGDFSGQLKLFCGDQVLSLIVLGSVVTVIEAERMPDEARAEEDNDAGGDGVGTSLPKVATRGPVTEDERRLSSLLFHYGIGAQREFNRSVPQIESMRVKRRGKTSLEMEWPEPGGAAYDYEIDIERLIRIPGYEGLVKFWIPFTEVTFRREGSNVVATLTALKTASNYRWRITTRSNDGQYSMPTVPFEVGTAFPAELPWKWICIGVGALFAAGFWIQQRRAALDDI